MTIKRYKELKKKYFCGTVYNNSVEMVKIGFFTAIGRPVPELDLEPCVQRWECMSGNDVWYRVPAPQHMKYEEI